MHFVIVIKINSCQSIVLECSSLAGEPAQHDHSHVFSPLPASPRLSDKFFVKSYYELKKIINENAE
jgi:hypothetical protein